MRVTRLILLLALLVPLTLAARPRDTDRVRPSDPATGATLAPMTSPNRPAPPRGDLVRPAVFDAAVTGASIIRWFGYYNPATRAAVPGECWTFDHGVGDPLEGWFSRDLTDGGVEAWRRITDAIWAGHDNAVPAPILSGTGSMWVGFFEDMADSLCWGSGLGYGNNWVQTLETPMLTFMNIIGPNVNLAYDYFCDTELGYDFVNVVLKVNNVRVTTLASYTGTAGSPSSPVHESLIVPVQAYGGPAASFSIVFELVTDGSYSDEDGYYPTAYGPFGLDDVALSTNIIEGDQLYTFETGTDGFTVSTADGVGAFMDVNPVSTYTLSDTSCSLAGNVLSFHDGSLVHPTGHNEEAVSPPVPVTRTGAGPYGIFADFDIYADLPVNAGVIWRLRWSYWPYVCPASGDSIWSTPSVSIPWTAGDPAACTAWRAYGTSRTGANYVPATADSVRLWLGIWSTCPETWVGNCSLPSNFSPIFDNIRVGFSNGTVRHVPGPDYATIQAAIDAAATGDTVLVKAGTYTGAGNWNLDFKGKEILVCSEDGPENTIIDCAGSARGFRFHTGETAGSILDGFTVTDGSGQGSGMRFESGSSPTVRHCRIVTNGDTGQDGGGVYVASSSPGFESCVIAGNTGAYGGGVAIVGGTPVFTDCLITGNLAHYSGGGVYVGLGTPSLLGCTVSRNEALNGTGEGIDSRDAVALERCIVNLNCGTYDVYAGTGATADLVCCDVGTSAGTGVSIDANSIFTDPVFCAPPDCGSVPTATGDFTLATHSPCLPHFSPCGGLIGALGLGCFGEYPQLMAVEDVPNDQGRQVRLTWSRSQHDGPTGPVITGYTVWRRVDPVFGPAPALRSRPERLRPLTHPGDWDYIALVPARGDDEYHTVAPTLCDSTDAGLCTSTFFVSAVTSDPLTYFDSETLSGYSVDNLAPTAPEGLIFSAYTLTWNEAPEEDFDYFTVYGSSVETFDESALVVGYTTEVGMDVHSAPWRYYHVTATDFAGNEGEAASTMNPISVPEPGVTPGAFALAPNRPNPFRSSTTIGLDLPETAPVRLAVYDVSGRLVRVLVETTLPAGRYAVPWPGDDERGRRVSPGIYFYRMEAGAFQQTRKALVLR